MSAGAFGVSPQHPLPIGAHPVEQHHVVYLSGEEWEFELNANLVWQQDHLKAVHFFLATWHYTTQQRVFFNGLHSG